MDVQIEVMLGAAKPAGTREGITLSVNAEGTMQLDKLTFDAVAFAARAATATQRLAADLAEFFDQRRNDPGHVCWSRVDHA